MPKMKKIICVDFDGVLHSYESGWHGADVVKDGPVNGAVQWLKEMVAYSDFSIHVYSSRSKQPGGIEAMRNALYSWGVSKITLSGIEWPTAKPAAWLSIDDRGFCFKGKFPTMEFIRDFKPCNKQT